MNKVIRETDKEYVESLIDVHGLEKVLELIGDICAGKAEHVLSCWQDETLSRKWSVNQKVVMRAQENIYHEL